MITILLVDDQKELLDITRLFLEKGGDITVNTALSAQEALTMLNQKKYDAIVSDYEMPAMDGIEFLKIIKHDDIEKPFIIFTGRSREDVVIEALNSGADFYLQKGSDPKVQFAELKNMIQQTVMRKRAEEALLQSETNYRTLVESTEDSIYMVDRNGRYLFMNSHHKVRLGIPGSEDRGRFYEELHTPQESERFLTLVREVIQTSRSLSDEYQRDGRWFIRTMSPVRNTIVELTIAVTVVSTEITRTRQLEQAFSALEAQYRILVESTQDSIYSVDRGCRYLYMNSHHKARLGILDDRYQDKCYQDYHSPEASERFTHAVKQVFDEIKPVREQYYNDDRCFVRTFSPVIDTKSGEITSVVVVSIETNH
ncbi:MAG: response regulator [Methanospirillum sp.]|uniref:response regulator n=1 Tax=Methanospirillum sp. TaxID=45200 RepID=UPI002369D2BB|nr:response regulator [Methanospirillum sp.]MDD1727646.1 response regulator [Methanospirillum sp.]